MRNKFTFILDPLFFISLILYTINKFVLIHWEFYDVNFFSSYFNDLLLVPVILPIILFFSKILKIRKGYYPPTIKEVAISLAIWSFAFEYVGPYCFKKGTSDPFDVMAYCIGGLLSWILWNPSNLLQVADCFGSGKYSPPQTNS